MQINRQGTEKQLNNKTTQQLHDSTTQRLHDSTTLQLYDFTTLRKNNFTTSQLHDFTTQRLYNFTKKQLNDFTTQRLYNFTKKQLNDFTTQRLYNFTKKQLNDFTTQRLYNFTTLRKNNLTTNDFTTLRLNDFTTLRLYKKIKNMHQFYFEKLDVWQNARTLSKDIYIITKSFPEDEKFGLISQIRRATTSIAANIAEGMARKTNKDKSRFLNQSYSSAIEVINFLIIANDLKYIEDNDYEVTRLKLEKITNQINALNNKLK